MRPSSLTSIVDIKSKRNLFEGYTPNLLGYRPFVYQSRFFAVIDKSLGIGEKGITMNRVKDILREGGVVIGAAAFPSDDVVFLAGSGFDFLLFDTQLLSHY